MNKRIRRCVAVISALVMAFILAVGAFAPIRSEAASFEKSKPVLKKTSAYLNNKVCLEWSKVSGAKSYEIQRAKVDKKGRTGEWKAWATAKKTSIKKKDTGDYKYRVRAVNGSRKSQWSTAKRVFAASAYITKMGHNKGSSFLTLRYPGKLAFRVLINNNTSTPMGIMRWNVNYSSPHTLYAVNKRTGKKLKTWELTLQASSNAQQINPGKKQSIYLYTSIYDEDWAKYKNCKFIITTSFYPNPEHEPMKNQMALAYSFSLKDSSVAAK